MNLIPIDYINTFISSNNPIAIGDFENELPKNKLNHYINCFAHHISTQSKSKKHQPSIAICLDRNINYILSIIATWKIGGYFIPLNTKWPKDRIHEIISHCQADIVICHKDGPYNKENALYIEDIDFNDSLPSYPTLILKPSDICYIIYTSGSTGDPKGVVITNTSYVAYIEWTKRYFNTYKTNKKLLITAELTFDITMGDIAFALAFGTSIYIAPDPKNIISTIKMIQNHKIDTFYSVPTTHSMVFEFAKRKKNVNLSSIKLILSGGDSFSVQLVKTIKDLLPNTHFYNVYGPTEVTINCFAYRLDNKISDLEKNGIPIGHAFDCIDSVLINPNNNTEASKEGHLCVTGNQVMLGYLSDPELTQKSFIKDPRYPTINRYLYKTGDIVKQNQNGLTYIIGRTDDLIKIQGYRINPNEVTKHILEIHTILEASTIAHEKNNNSQLISFISLSEPIDNEKIISHLKTKLPAYMIPKKIIPIKKFPLNNSGKISKKELKIIYENYTAAN